ncbi:DUF6658 family protein [Anabaena sp. UHCC 0451]|uniref:DUF6658 family protein n=1 Tax=Anabaena sp. UHCC 0451 TaxID=2055235 RepID=UPI002B20109D|nr:DUF6658 family protein [Anabaena sp. UHCC 0451]MEA5575537.1 DUF6658 family protein [Anabaena sp. UHCC 0451]
MKNLINFLKNRQIRQIVTIFLAGILLIVSTACSGVNLLKDKADEASARPELQKKSSIR